MATTEDITIKITVDDEGAVRVLNQTGEELEKVGTKSEKASRGFSSFQASVIAVNQALQLGKAAFAALTNELDRARTVEGVASGFENLQGSTEAAAATLGGLQSATQGLVSDFDLMQQANQAVLLGLPTEGLNELAEAALKLGATTGRTAKEALGDLITGLGRASPLILDNLGITIKAAEAQELYAAKLKKSVDNLTESEKAEAFRFGAMEKIRAKSAELNDIQETSAVVIQKVAAQWTNLTDELRIFLSNNQGLASLLENVAGALKGLADAWRLVNQAMGGNELAQSKLALKGVQQELAALDAGKVYGVGNAMIDTSKRAKELQMQAKLLEEDIKELEEGAVEAAKALSAKAGATDKATASSAKSEKQLEKERKAAEQLLETQLAQAEKVQKAAEATDEYQEILAQLEKGTIDNVVAGDKLQAIYGEIARESKALEVAEANLALAIAGVGEGAEVTAEQLAEMTKAVNDAKEAQKQLGDGTKKNGFLDGLFGGSLFGEGVSEGIEQDVGAEISQGIQNAITNIDLSDIRGSIAGSGGGIGGAAGAAIGTSIGGAAGGAIGNALGEELGANLTEAISKIGTSTKDSIGGLLDLAFPLGTFGFGEKIVDALGIGGKSASAAARDKADAFFEDLLDANRVSLVIDGQLKEIKDIAENDFQGFFESLDTSTEAGLAQYGGFDSIGRALEEQLGVADDISGQIGAILGNNVGGSLNNLQILFQELGISQEDLAAGIEESWLNGDTTAQQFLETQRQIENLYAKGIPDGVGRTDLAFQNLIESGGAGRQVVDALGDAAIEAQEKGISTLEGLKDELIASGADAEKVSQAFDAIAAAGITTLDGLADVSVQSAAVISSQLESTGTFFEDVTQSLEEIQQRLDAIKDKEINITYNVKTNVDSATREFGLAGDLPGSDLQQGATA